MTIINPLMPPRLGVGSIPNTVPFTMRENFSQMGLVEGMREWIDSELVPFINSNINVLATMWVEQANRLIDDFEVITTGLVTNVNDAVAEIGDRVEDAEAAKVAAEAARDLAEQYASDAEAIQDTAVTGIVQDEESALYTALTEMFASANGLADVVSVLAGRLSADTLDARFADKADAPVNGKRAVGADEIFINVLDYGAMGDSDGATGGTDDSAAIALAIEAAVTANRPVWFPRVAYGYRTDSPVIIPGTVDVLMDSPVYSNHEAIGISYNPAPGGVSFRRVLRLMQVRATQSNWASEANIGIVTRNVVEANINIPHVAKNTIGWLRLGDNAGHVHNVADIALIVSNKIGVDCDALGTGWVNEEKVNGGRFSVTTGTNRSLSRIGVRIRATSGYYHNAQTFDKPSFELNKSNLLDGAEAIPILVEHGMYNRFLDVRDENNGTVVIRTLNASEQNEVTVAYGSASGSLAEDLGTRPSSMVNRTSRMTRDRAYHRVFDSGNLAKRAVEYAASTLNIPGMVAMRSADGTIRRQDIAILNSDHVRLSAGRSIGKIIDVAGRGKRFVARRTAIAEAGGRVVIKCYDAAMSPIGDATTPLIKTLSAATVAFTTTYAGAYVTGVDSVADFYFVVDPSVRYIYVGVTGGTNPADMVSLSMDALETGAVEVPYFPENIHTPMATQAPTTGTYNRGMRIANGQPGVGLPKGWVCTESGTPGTWVSEGTL